MPKKIDIVAGPNGSGKTTFAESFLVRTERATVFLNPDVIASGFSTIDFKRASFKAGRLLLGDVKDRISRGESFAFETTMAGLSYAQMLKRAIQQGYDVNIFFLYLSSVSKNLQRIRSRVRLGGHDIPKDAVLRRQQRCFQNFWDLYRPLSTHWYVFDNSGSLPELKMESTYFDISTASEQKRFLAKFKKVGGSRV